MATFKDVLDRAASYLRARGEEKPRFVAEMLVAHVTGKTRADLYLLFDEPLDKNQSVRLQDMLKRRAAGEPLQYLLGEAPFRHLILKVAPGVLIPRPETETLVDVAMGMVGKRLQETQEGQAHLLQGDQKAFWKKATSDTHAASKVPIKYASAISIADVGTGSGAIALSLAQELPRFLQKPPSTLHVYASDISSRALELARENASDLNSNLALDASVRLTFLQSDLFEQYPKELQGQLDLIVSNPPYLPDAVLEQEVSVEVKEHEPWEALSGGLDGLDSFRRLARSARIWLKEGGIFCVELFEGSLDAAAEFLREENECAAGGLWGDVKITKDLTGRPRVLSARLQRVPGQPLRSFS